MLNILHVQRYSKALPISDGETDASARFEIKNFQQASYVAPVLVKIVRYGRKNAAGFFVWYSSCQICCGRS